MSRRLASALVGTFALTAALVAPALGCGADEPEDLGQFPLDEAVVADSPALEHVGESRAGGGALTLAELLREPELALTSAPDPSVLLERQREEHAGLAPIDDGVNLRVLTYNLNLIDRWYPFTTVTGYEVDHRRVHVPPLLMSEGWDVIFFQELFEEIDVERMELAAADRGYRLYSGTARGHDKHGLAIAVREALIAGDERFHERIYEFQRDVETFPGPGMARGFLSWSFVHAPTGRRIWVVGTHTTAFPDYWRQRTFQARELGLYVRERPEDDVVVVGGDFNAAPYYPKDTFGVDGGDEVGEWWRNALMYPVMLHYGGVIDVMATVRGAEDVTAMLALPEFDADAWDREPYGDASRCDGDEVVFSWDWCNSVAFTNYSGASEYPGRLDYIFVRDDVDAVRVLDAGLEYTKPVELAGLEIEMSDHHAVGATLRLRSDR